MTLLGCGAAFAQQQAAPQTAATCTALKCEEAKVHFGGGLQFRYTWDTNTNDVGSDNTNGFSTPLARIHMNGNVTKDIDFKVEGAFNSETNDFGLLDAYAGVSFSENTRLQVGQFRLPFLFEQNVDAEMQMAAQTSAFSNIFGQGYSQGVQFACGNDKIRFRTAVSDGFNTANTNFDNAVESDFALTARLDFAALGNLHSFSEFTAGEGDGNGLLLGAAAHYQDENSVASKLFTYTADVNWKVGGWSVYGAGVARTIDDATSSFDDFGFIGQTAYRINKFEPFARYEMILPDTDRNLSSDTYSFATAGVNYYLYGQAAKFTVDAVYAFEATEDISDMNGLSTNSLVSTEKDGEISLVAQFQVLF